MILISLFFTNLSFINQVKASEDNYFIVTAYYSPLPDQKTYLKWNYEDEKKLNWEWLNWASGKKVFIGMLAAPQNYSFWTKIELEWLGIWEVADRWWAIVMAWNRWYEYDRIDVWMWYGDEWLKRALAWWKRKIKWNVVDKNTLVNLDYTKSTWVKYISPKIEIQKIEIIDTKTSKKIIKEEVKIVSIFDSVNLDSQQVKELSIKLKELSIYNWVETSNYKDLSKTIIDYQVKKWLIKDYNDIAAWYFWPKTRTSLKTDYEVFTKEKQQKLALENEIKNLTILAIKESNQKIDSIWYPKFGETSKNIRELQLSLKQLWFFNEKDTAIFWEKTKQAIFSYQLSKWLVSKSDDLGAGMIWPKTASSIKADLTNIYLTQKIWQNKQLSEIKNTKNISNNLNIMSL